GRYDPAPGIDRFGVGTPPVLGAYAVAEGAGLVAEAGVDALRAKGGRAYRVPDQAGRRLAGAAGLPAGLPAGRRAARLARDAAPPARLAGLPGADRSPGDPRLPHPGPAAARPGPALHPLRGRVRRPGPAARPGRRRRAPPLPRHPRPRHLTATAAVPPV